MRQSQRFEPQGPIALDPRAFGMLFEVEQPSPLAQNDGVAVIDVRGPLMHHSAWCWDSYESIRDRVAQAVAVSPKAVVLRVDSPGGLVSGMLECARAIRDLAESAQVPLVAYVDGAALSAAYAIACGCACIYTSETGLLGSIGTIETLTDATEQAARYGLKHRLVVSGARKADGHPTVPISEEAVAATQERVDGLAELFFEHVANARGMSVEQVRALEAGLSHGAAAVALGLADEVTTFDNLLATLASDSSAAAKTAEDDMTHEEKARKALQAVIDDDDADDKAKANARKALSAMDDSDDDDKKESKAEGDDKSDSSDDDDKEAKASASTPSVQAPVEASKEMAVGLAFLRGRMLNTRPDLSPKVRAYLEGKSLTEVEEYLELHPKPKASSAASKAAAVASVAPTRGENRGDQVSRLPADEAHDLDVQMGLAQPRARFGLEGTKLYLGAMTRSQARAEIDKRTKAAEAGVRG